MFNTLYRKLALISFLLVFTIGAVFFQIIRYSTEMYQQEVAQKLNIDLAANIVHEKNLIKNKVINKKGLKHVFHMLMVINPSIEMYLIDPQGKILDYFAPKGKVKRKSISLTPVHQYIEKNTSYPLLGDDPRDEAISKVFSAARIPAKGPLEGYMYIILGGEKLDSITDMLENSYILRSSLWGLGAGLLVAFIMALILFSMLTGRLGRLSKAMNEFSSNSDNAKHLRIQVDENKDDEINQLSKHFNNMADTIEKQFSAQKKNDQLRRELIANISHDLRTPITSLQGYLETLIYKELDESQKTRYLNTAYDQSHRLSQLVSDLFELAKLDSCETIVYAEPFSLGELIQDIIQKFEIKAKKKNIHLKTDFCFDVPNVYGDIAMVQRLLENLIENAIRYTNQDGVVDVGFIQQGNKIQIKIQDTGCGIPKENLGSIFDRFYRVDNSRSTSVSSGLGLAIVKRIIDLHGSTINVESIVNKGTSFIFDMPLCD